MTSKMWRGVTCFVASGIIGLFASACSQPVDEEEDTGATSNADTVSDGTCNAMPNNAPPITSTCLPAIMQINFPANKLVAGFYDLTSEGDIGSNTFCTHSFASHVVKERIEILVVDPTRNIGRIRAVTSVDGAPDVHHTDRLLPHTPEASSMTYQHLCPTAPDSTASQFGTYTAGGKTFFRTRIGFTFREYTMR